ncbi:unnamed protein product [Psylliodes chrysocephalus]|uniref:Saposin B-type domain-containing protein n=1 Tax=Psylliodes chrysocephalus TaxID=3402493 RepID=A0A9P0G9Q4_9CUCU|nr:unnamed protein product [Psylliodes chrysocephala]
MKCLGLWIFFLAAISLTYAANKPNCKSCLTVAEVGKDILSSGVTDEQIEKIGHLACTFVPEFVKGLCPSMIDKVYKNVYNEVVVNGMTPKDICHEVKLC